MNSVQSRQYGLQGGAALSVGLLIYLVVVTLGVAALSSAVMELRMAAGAQYQERAFQAAEFGIEQAIRSPLLSTAHTYSSPLVVPATGSPPPVPGSSGDTYSYRVYYNAAAGGTPVPAAGSSPDPGLQAYHFVIEATGSSAQGAVSEHVQGFYVIVSAGPPPANFPSGCPPAATACGPAVDLGRVRTYWLQENAE